MIIIYRYFIIGDVVVVNSHPRGACHAVLSYGSIHNLVFFMHFDKQAFIQQYKYDSSNTDSNQTHMNLRFPCLNIQHLLNFHIDEQNQTQIARALNDIENNVATVSTARSIDTPFPCSQCSRVIDMCFYGDKLCEECYSQVEVEKPTKTTNKTNKKRALPVAKTQAPIVADNAYKSLIMNEASIASSVLDSIASQRSTSNSASPSTSSSSSSSSLEQQPPSTPFNFLSFLSPSDYKNARLIHLTNSALYMKPYEFDDMLKRPENADVAEYIEEAVNKRVKK